MNMVFMLCDDGFLIFWIVNVAFIGNYPMLGSILIEFEEF